MKTNNALTWFEIPVDNMVRASGFYQVVLGRTLNKQTFGPHELCVFPYEQPGIGGCLMHAEAYRPSQQGVVVYLPVADGMQAALQRVTRAGGQVLLGRTELPEGMGCYAHVLDTEGNRVGLHAQS
jgi:uncharacterized protein